MNDLATATLAAGGGQERGVMRTLPGDARVSYARQMDSLDDSALMLRYAQDGDTAAFEQLYSRHKDSVYRYLLRHGFKHEAAEDIFQEVWGKIIRARENYRPTALFTTYLYRVAHNCFVDYLRRNSRHSDGHESYDGGVESADDSPDASTERLLARRRLLDALRDLPEEQRDAFLLHEEASLSIDQVAQVTGVNRETAKSRVRYAVAKLKAAMNSEGAAS